MDILFRDSLTKDVFDFPLSIDTLNLPELTDSGLSADVLRLDKIHPVLSGNKWFKLKNHLLGALKKPGQGIVTFGGPWSNHLVATAYAARELGIAATGLIRGERPPVLSETLREAAGYGMQLEFISREDYRTKDSPLLREVWGSRYPGACIVPEGGGGPLGELGSEEILRMVDSSAYTHILCAIGTGTMFRGLVNAAAPGQIVMGVSVLKGMVDSRLLTGYHFGGYARYTKELIEFMNGWYRRTGIPSDFVYTGKLFYAVMDSIREGRFPSGSRLLLIHSGGLQGNRSLAPGVLDF